MNPDSQIRAGFGNEQEYCRAMQPLDESPPRHRRQRNIMLWMITLFALYVLSAGPVAWATNDGYHDAYLPPQANLIYLPLEPLLQIGWMKRAFHFYTVLLWEGFPAGYTTL